MKNKAGVGAAIVCNVFTFSTEASFSYKISYSYSTQISIVFRFNAFLSKHLLEIVLFAFYLQCVSVRNGPSEKPNGLAYDVFPLCDRIRSLLAICEI